ncbi:MAG: LAGLIDADG family homing endonuclease [Angustibacter sp.]
MAGRSTSSAGQATSAARGPRPGPRGWSGRARGGSMVVQAADEWRGTTVQTCGLWPFATGAGSPMIGVPLGRNLLTGSTLCCDPISWFQRARLISNPSAFVLSKPGLGKALDLDTIVPTPDGWSRIGRLAAGDQVLGGDGRPVQVVAVSEVMTDRDCWELEFSTGERIVADAEHLWVTRTAADRYRATPTATAVRDTYQPVMTQADRAALVTAREELPERASRRAVAHALDWDDGRLHRVYQWARDLGLDGHGRVSSVAVLDRVEERLTRSARRVVSDSSAPVTTAMIASTLRARGKTNHSVPVIGSISFGVDKPFEVSVCRWCGDQLPVHRGGRTMLWCGQSCKDRGRYQRRTGYGRAAAPSGRAKSAVPPVPPYTLGYWLGDGTRGTSHITTADKQVPQLIAAEGCEIRSTSAALRYSIRLRDATPLSIGLRRLGVLEVKRIPPSYLRASIEHRRSMLAGLLDSDGTVSACGGQIQFTTTSAELAQDVAELVASLGHRPAVHSKPARLRGRACGTAWQVGFCAAESPFRLDRKSVSHAERSSYRPRRNSDRYIVAARRVPSRPVRCIQVANPDGMFLIGRTYIATHNSTLVRRMALGLAGYGVSPLVLGDLRPDYVDLVEALSGQVLRVGRGRGYLNVLDQSDAAAAARRLTGQARQDVLSDAHGRRAAMVASLLTILRAAPPSDREEAIVDRSLRILDDRHDGVYDVPVVADLLRVVKDAPQDVRDVALDRGDISRYRDITEGLEATLTSLAGGSRFGDTFSRATSAPMHRDRPVVFDVSSIGDNEMDFQAAALLACWSYGFGVVNTAHALADAGLEPRRHYLVVMDELWRALRAGHGIVDRVDVLTRLNRGKGVGQVMISHTMSDLLALPDESDRMKARGFVERSGMVICGGLPSAEMPKLRDVVQLSRAEEQMLVGWQDPPAWDPVTGAEAAPPGRGRFLVKVGGRAGIPVQVELTQVEESLRINDTNRLWHDVSRLTTQTAETARAGSARAESRSS